MAGRGKSELLLSGTFLRGSPVLDTCLLAKHGYNNRPIVLLLLGLPKKWSSPDSSQNNIVKTSSLALSYFLLTFERLSPRNTASSEYLS